MDVLLKICRDQGRANSLNPADFDSSISAIANLPVKQFMTAAKDGWGPYFRNLHSNMRKETTARSTTTAKRMNRPPPERRRRSSQQQHPPLPLPRRASSGATKDEKKNNRRYSKVANDLHHMVRSADVASSDSNNRRRRRQSEDDNSDGLAASRARAAKRQAEEMVIRRMGVRLQALWQELKIPDPDRAYVTAAYLDAGGGGGGFSGQRARGGGGIEEPPVGSGGGGGGNSGPTSENVNRELTRQIRLLLEHRAATVKVLRCVNARESRLCEVEQALQAFQWHRGLDTDALGVVVSLAGLRDASLDVVRAVEEWRTNLWQPRAFCWRGVNYLEKMWQDTIFLRSPVGQSLLASVGLEAKDMTFVLYPSGNGGGAPSAIPGDSSTCGSELSDGERDTKGDVLRPPPAIVRLTPKAELVSAYRARYFEQSPVVGAGGRPGGESGDVGGERGRLKSTAAAATAAMEAVVVQEAALQRRVEAERVRLATKGCFVPLLRWLPGDSRNPAPKGKRRWSSSSPPSVPPAARNPPPGAESETHAAKDVVDSFAHNDGRSGVPAVRDVSVSAAIPPDPLTGGAEEESRSETDIARRSACTVGAEARAGENGCLKVVATSECGVGSAGIPVGGVSSGDDGDGDTDKPSIVPGELRQEGIVDEERSVAPSVCYDDDFEEDAEGYSLSDSETSGEGGSADFGECLNGSISSDDAKDARRDQGVAHTTEEEGAAISCGEGRQNPVVGGNNVLTEHQRQQQLVEERETVAATAALRIQRREISENVDLRQQQEAEPDPELAGVGVCRGTARQGEEEILAVSSEFDSAEAATRSDRSARTIQKAVRRRLSSGNTTSKADGLPAMEIKGQPKTLEEEAQGQPDAGKRGDGPGAVLVNRCGSGDGSFIPSQQAPVVAAESSSPVVRAGDELDSPSSPAAVDGTPSSTPASGADGLDARLSDADGKNNRPDVAESAFVEAGLPSTSLPSEDSAESETADDAAGGDLSQTLQHPREGSNFQPEGASSWSPLPSPTTPRPEAAERGQQENDHQPRQVEGGGEAAVSLPPSSATACPPTLGPTVDVFVGLLPVDTDTSADAMMTTVGGTHAGGGAESLGFSAVGLSPVPERQALVAVAASASEYGSEDPDFDALSSSPGGSSRGGVSRGEEENAGVAARVATRSSVVTTGEKVEEPTESRGVERVAAPVAAAVAGAATEKNLAGDIEPVSLAAAEVATTKEVERGGTQCTEDGSDNSSIVSLSVSSGS
ncbi:hypothetical protein Esi_0018_0054 [Ectocarpus siliculosus]|uniref:Uncharacterized protein n=1 Tax=Ectocarpus siliculosus TaxID=2880 RepID=D7FNH8_ECTSI|nr:hypothetical protein Esi_0018_0054 [Ectocarpus siliculosus]|eukprot:CBJ25989.1 hypothetical protein Esi_0018_0054 [Ectocarpus siliculosus]